MSLRKETPFLGLEDLEGEDVTFEISFFLSTTKGSAVLGCNRVSQMQCAAGLIKFCGNWMHKLRADLAGTAPKAVNCFQQLFFDLLFFKNVFPG